MFLKNSSPKLSQNLKEFSKSILQWCPKIGQEIPDLEPFTAVCKEGCLNGHCSSPGECICNRGWTGPNCTQCLTLPGCSEDNGYCSKPMECNCKSGYQGTFCEKFKCRYFAVHISQAWVGVFEATWSRHLRNWNFWITDFLHFHNWYFQKLNWVFLFSPKIILSLWEIRLTFT